MKLPDLPLVDVYRQGRLDLDAFVSEEIELDEWRPPSKRIHHGDVLRSVVILQQVPGLVCTRDADVAQGLVGAGKHAHWRTERLAERR
jgi:hypothetical protein